MSKKSPKALEEIKVFKPITINQNDFCEAVEECPVVILEAIAGTGKSYCAVGLACKMLLEGKIDKILISRSTVGCGAKLPFTPGSFEEKVESFMTQYLQYLKLFLGRLEVERLIYEKKIVLMQVEILRSLNFEKTFMILEEAQNCTPAQIKLFLTRMGKNSKAVIVGCSKQCDIKDNGLDFVIDILDDVDGVDMVYFDRSDIQRHPILGDIIEQFENNGV